MIKKFEVVYDNSRYRGFNFIYSYNFRKFINSCCYNFGNFCCFSYFKPIKSGEFEKLVRDISFSKSPSKIEDYVNDSNLFDWQKDILVKIAKNHDIGVKARKALASELISSEETRLIKITNKTDILIRLGPILGLLGTLIPLGPGLAALGSGDITTLAESLTIAFDTTVTGLAVGGVAYLISKFKKQWYESDLIDVETLAEVELESLNNQM